MDTESLRVELGKATERGLSFLRSLGFDFAGVTEHATDALGTFMEGDYTNSKANRIVRVVYIPKQQGPGELAITQITLVVPEPFDDFDYTSTGSMEVCVTDLSAAEGDWETRIEYHLRASESALRNTFMAVLAGDFWQSDHIDWGGLK
jgi:hypothetical protein